MTGAASTQGDLVDESDLVPLSALQHWLYCPRQCALIHVERLWQENRFTAEGRVLHERVDEPGGKKRRGVRTVTAMPVRSLRLGVFGIADVVEFHETGGGLIPFPVDYKRGRPKAHRADEVQLCAQAMALEEMFSCGTIVSGALFYGETRRRREVSFDAGLRQLTAETALAMRACIDGVATPEAVYERRKCDSCSLIELCRPRICNGNRNVASWFAAEIAKHG